jgi:hypothetical protein
VPPTAQPVTHVTLTTWPKHRFNDDGRTQIIGHGQTHWVPRGESFDHSRRGIVTWLLEQEWPTVKFTLPSATDATH